MKNTSYLSKPEIPAGADTDKLLEYQDKTLQYIDQHSTDIYLGKIGSNPTFKILHGLEAGLRSSVPIQCKNSPLIETSMHGNIEISITDWFNQLMGGCNNYDRIPHDSSHRYFYSKNPCYSIPGVFNTQPNTVNGEQVKSYTITAEYKWYYYDRSLQAVLDAIEFPDIDVEVQLGAVQNTSTGYFHYGVYVNSGLYSISSSHIKNIKIKNESTFIITLYNIVPQEVIICSDKLSVSNDNKPWSSILA